MDLGQVRPTWAEIDLDAIAHNVRELSRLAPGARFMAVVKADGYGHGAAEVARAALKAGASWLGVATVEEGVALRRAGIKAPVLVLGYISPMQASAVLLHGLRPTVFHADLAEALSRKAASLGRTVPVHLKVDTGMTRVGVRPHEAVPFAQMLTALPNLELEGVFTHLATADEPTNPYASEQLARFDQVLAALKQAGIEPRIRHAANSAALMLLPQAHYDLVRAGIALYGQPPDPQVEWPASLRPALAWRTRVGMVKWVEPDTPISYGCTYRTRGRERIASLPVGYADGLSRLLSNRGEVLIHGRRCPIVGRICMDQTMVRVPDDLDVKVGDEVVLIGEQGVERITASDLAQTIGTINYEIVCSIGKRVPRLYRKGGQLTHPGIL